MNIKRSLLLLLIAAAMLLPLLCACSVNTIENTEDFAGKKLGIVTGTMFESVAREYYPEAELCFFNTSADLAEALNKDKIDAYMLDEPIGRIVVKPYPDQEISKVIEAASYAYAFAKDNERSDTLRKQMDAFINECRKNGTLQEIDDIWFGDDDTRKTVTIDDLSDKNGTVRLATSTDIGEPFVYFKDGGLVGYEIDLLARFCREYGYGLEMTNYTFSAILAAIKSGKDDIAASTLAITAERKESVNFSSPTYDGGIVVVTKNSAKFTLESLSNKKVGIPAASVFDTVLLKQVPDAHCEYINTYADLSVALDTGKIDAYVADEPVARLMGKRYTDQSIVYKLEDASYGFMFPKGDKKHETLCDQMNALLAQYRKDGTLEKIDSIWFGDDESLQVVDMSDLSGENGVLEMVISTDVGAPFAYLKNGKMVGYDVDVAVRFCREYGYGLHISDYNIAGLLAATSSGKADMSASSINITPERLETSLMSDPDYVGGIVIVTREDKDKDGDGNSFFASLRDSFERTFIREDRWKLFLSGLGTTFMITTISVIIGSLGGFGVYRIRRHKNKVFNAVWSFFASVMGRTPVVVILMILYYIIFGHSNLSSVWVSIIGFTLLFTCTVAELLEMGAGAVDGGQTEAALAMGYSERQTYLRIIFPQSIDHFLPAYKSEVISLVKATAVVGYIAVQDLTKVSDLIRARTYEAFFPLIATAIIYYLLTLALTRIISHINVLSDPRRRDAKKILHGIETK